MKTSRGQKKIREISKRTGREKRRPVGISAENSKLNELHKEFLVNMAAAFVTNSSELARQLNSNTVAAEYDFPPVKVSSITVSRFLRSVDKIELGRRQADFLQDLTRSPFAHKRNRIDELEKLYHQVDEMCDEKGKPLSDAYKLSRRIELLREVRTEVAEDMDKLCKAVQGAAEAQGAVMRNVVLSAAMIKELGYVLTNSANILASEETTEIVEVSTPDTQVAQVAAEDGATQ